jgi:hypothetical protein
MTNNPILNAFAALAYIALVSLVINYGPLLLGPVDEGSLKPILPVAFLSLFVLSAAVMGYIFCMAPLRRYLDGKKEEGVRLFLMTIGIFALLTCGVFLFVVLLARL